jgi:hypothetical protein
MNLNPACWMYDTSGVLHPVIEIYLSGEPMTPEHVAIVKVYLHYWVRQREWRDPEYERLRETVDGLQSRDDITAWIDQARAIKLDPL